MSVHSFDSFEEMFEFMHRNEQIANEKLMPAQKTLTWGSRVVRVAYDTVIFGHVYTRQEGIDNEVKAGASREEAEWSAEALAESLTRGYLFGRWYSVIEPRGEIGSAHRVNCWPIPHTMFASAQAADWDPAKLRDDDKESLIRIIVLHLSQVT